MANQPPSRRMYHLVNEQAILRARGPKNPVDPRVPYACLVESEATAAGTIADVATIFLTNGECPFHCLYCDLWKNTTDERVAPGVIPGQIQHALARLPPAEHIKLYNSGNFFDRQAIPPEDYAEIARLVCGFQTVIVENHPRLCGPACLEFRDLLHRAADQRGNGQAPPEFEIAMGLETAHPEILPRLNKQMTLGDFQRACESLVRHGMSVRAFILLQPPYMTAADSVDWALRSINMAFECGVRVCAVIPTRSGNGILQQLEQDQEFAPPRIRDLEAVLDQGLQSARGRVFVDLWDVERFYDCPRCGPQRAARLRQMNLTQQILPPVSCSCT